MTLSTESALAPFPPLWLRDNCPCERCQDPKSNQKLFQPAEIANTIAIAEVDEAGDKITVTFSPDGHRSVFSR
jgi:gamma-butyrobetaine dioxygenase